MLTRAVPTLFFLCNARMQVRKPAKPATRPATLPLLLFIPQIMLCSVTPQLRKINCSLHLQNAVAKFAWWVAMWHAGLASEVPTTSHPNKFGCFHVLYMTVSNFIYSTLAQTQYLYSSQLLLIGHQTQIDAQRGVPHYF